MLTLIDNITIVLCVVGIFAISIFMSKKNTDMEAYYHANKALPWSLAVGTIAASWYGGNGTIGTVGYVTTMGLSAFFIWSIGAHLVRFPLALWVAPRISVKVNSTMTELLDRFYGRIASFIGAIVLLATCLSISEIGADTLGYLRLERLPEMVNSLGICTGCFTGDYPIPAPEEDIRGEYEA